MDYKKDEIQQHFNDYLEYRRGSQTDIDELRDELIHDCFNSNYYIIGRHRAREWMGEEAFNIVSFIKDYEEMSFGEILTDLSEPERVLNMYVYIIGEEIVADYINKLEKWTWGKVA